MDQRNEIAPFGPEKMLTGAVATMSAALALQPGSISYDEAAVGALVVGLTAISSATFNDIVKTEAERGHSLRLADVAKIVDNSAPIMIFPVATAIGVYFAGKFGVAWPSIINWIMASSVGLVFVLGFFSRYAVDGDIGRALKRAAAWTTLGGVLYGAKLLA